MRFAVVRRIPSASAIASWVNPNDVEAKRVARSQQPTAKPRVGAVGRIAGGGALRLRQHPALAGRGEAPGFLALTRSRVKSFHRNNAKPA